LPKEEKPATSPSASVGPDREHAEEGGRVLGDAVAVVAGRGDHDLAGAQDDVDREPFRLRPLGAAEAQVDHVDVVVEGDVVQRLHQVGDGDALAVAVHAVGHDGRLGGDAGGAVPVVEGGDHAGHLGSVGAGRRGLGVHAPVVRRSGGGRQRQRWSTWASRSSTPSMTPVSTTATV
jgi:hypothetical protein